MHGLVLGVVVGRLGRPRGDVDRADVVQHVTSKLLQRRRSSSFLQQLRLFIYILKAIIKSPIKVYFKINTSEPE